MPQQRRERTDPVDSYEHLRWLEDVQRAAREWGVDVAQVKPCAGRIYGIQEPSRNNAAFVLATEWRRMGIREDRGQQIAARWNEGNLPPLPPLELDATVRSAFEGPEVYGCNGPLSEWCVGKESCPFRAQFLSGKAFVPGRMTAVDFDRLGWRWPHVTPAERLVYHGLVRLEAARDMEPGALVITSTRQLARLVGLSPSGVLHALRALHHLALITYEPGTARGQGLPPKGSRIRREIPIPDPQHRNPNWGREVRRRLRRRVGGEEAGRHPGMEPPE